MQTPEHFITHDTMTQIIEMKSMIKDIPTDIEGIVKIVQNTLLHQHWAKQYGIELNEQKISEVYVRPIDDKLKLLKQKDIHTLSEPISYDKKLIGICRDFSVLMSSLCREVGYLQELDVDLRITLKKESILIIGSVKYGIVKKTDG